MFDLFESRSSLPDTGNDKCTCEIPDNNIEK